MDTKLLREIGLTNREIEVYLKLIEKGESPASDIAKETSVSRTHVYESLELLAKKGLVSSITKDFRKYYSATDPERILNYLEEEQKKIEQQKENVNKLVQDLKKLKKPLEKKPIIEKFEGKEGVKTILLDTLKIKKGELLVINASKDFIKNFPIFAQQYFKEKIKRKIPSKIIFSEKFELLDPTTQKRFILKEQTTPTMTLIYENKVAIIFWVEKPMGILIQSEEASKEYKTYFDILWNQAKPWNIINT